MFEAIASIHLILRVRGEQPSAALLILNRGEITNETEPEAALRRNLAVYLYFVTSGQFSEDHPDLSDTELFVEIVCSTPPTAGTTDMDAARSPSHFDYPLPIVMAKEKTFHERLRL